MNRFAIRGCPGTMVCKVCAWGEYHGCVLRECGSFCGGWSDEKGTREFRKLFLQGTLLGAMVHVGGFVLAFGKRLVLLLAAGLGCESIVKGSRDCWGKGDDISGGWDGEVRAIYAFLYKERVG